MNNLFVFFAFSNIKLLNLYHTKVESSDSEGDQRLLKIKIPAKRPRVSSDDDVSPSVPSGSHESQSRPFHRHHPLGRSRKLI